MNKASTVVAVLALLVPWNVEAAEAASTPSQSSTAKRLSERLTQLPLWPDNCIAPTKEGGHMPDSRKPNINDGTPICCFRPKRSGLRLLTPTSS